MELAEHLSIDRLKKDYADKIALSAAAKNRIAHNREFLDNVLRSGNTYYGINTGDRKSVV